MRFILKKNNNNNSICVTEVIMRINETIYIVHLAQYLAHHKLSIKNELLSLFLLLLTIRAL